ncbi:MAG: GNAT family N-acetyltransferase [Flavonifractor plautii]
MSLTLRHEAPADHRAVETLVREAFWNVYKPGCDEHYYLHLLRQSPRLPPGADLRMRGGRRPAGRIACASSSIELEAARYLDTVTFGPLAVLPFQGKGLARALVCHALRQAQALGEQAVVILGDPRHYGRYGFWCGGAGASPWRTASTCPASGSGAGPRLPGKRRRALPRGLCLCPRCGRAGRF